MSGTKKCLSREPLPRLLKQVDTPAAQSLFRKLESLEQEADIAGHTGHARWMIPYADLLTLLLGFFLVLFAASGVELKKLTPAILQGKTISAKVTAQKAKSIQPIPASTKNHQPTQADAKLAETLKRQLNTQGIEIRPQERGLVISLQDNILFAPGQAELSPQARQTMDRLVEKLNRSLAISHRPIRVEGHTDDTPISTPQFPSNWELSTARATNIVRYLVGMHHFAPDQLSAAGYGEFRPVENNSSIEGKQKNRRVDIVVLNTELAQQEPPAHNHPAR
jgi:chemotaxis protein MotB